MANCWAAARPTAQRTSTASFTLQCRGPGMEGLIQLLAALLRIALIPLLGYALVRLARRWPRTTLALLLAVLALGAGALGYAWQDGFSVARDTRTMAFQSEAGRWC